VRSGDIQPEKPGYDFFCCRPYHIITTTRVQDLARASNAVQKALNSGAYTGAIWLESSPSVEETIYWLNLLIDRKVPIACTLPSDPMVRFRPTVSAISLIISVISPRIVGGTKQVQDLLGSFLLQDEQIFAALLIQKEGRAVVGISPGQRPWRDSGDNRRSRTGNNLV